MGPEPEVPGCDFVEPGETGAARFREYPQTVTAVFPDAGDIVGGEPELLVVQGNMLIGTVFARP